MPDPIQLPPGATLVEQSGGMALPPGATLVTPKSSAISRFGTSAREAVGIPEHPIEDLTGGVKFAAQNPGQAAKQLVMTPVDAYKSAVTAQQKRMADAFKRGDYTEAAIHGLYYLLSPVGGANLGKAGEQLKEGDIAGAAGTTAGTALPMVAGSPEVRANVGTATNAARSAIATGLEKGAAPASTIATLAATAHELFGGRPINAALTATLGKPAIARTMNMLAKGIRPGEEGMVPLPSNIPASVNRTFLNSPGIEGEVPQAKRLALPAGPIELGEGEVIPPNMAQNPGKIVVRDPQTGRMRTFFTNASAEEAGPTQYQTEQAAQAKQAGQNLEPPANARFSRPMSGESAALQSIPANMDNLLSIAHQRGIPIPKNATAEGLLKDIVGSLTEKELAEFEAQAAERSRFPRTVPTPQAQPSVPAVGQFKASSFEQETPQFAYRVRDAGEKGVMPRGHAQATMDQAQAESYVSGRGNLQGQNQELVRIDLSKLDPSEYTLKSGPGGKQWVQFKKPVPEAYIERMPAEKGAGPSPSATPQGQQAVHAETGLPLNSDGTVTLYHGTTKEGAAAIRSTGRLKSAGEPDVYLTTQPEGTGYGDGTVVAVRVDPAKLQIDDEFPSGRKDFRISTGKPGGSVPIKLDTTSRPQSGGIAVPETEWNANTMQRNLEYLRRLRSAKAGDD